MTTLQFISAAIGIFIVVSMVMCYATLWAEPRDDDQEGA